MKVTEGQRKGLAKYLYDVSKLVMAGTVLSPIVGKDQVPPGVLVLGLGAASAFAIIAFFLDR